MDVILLQLVRRPCVLFRRGRSRLTLSGDTQSKWYVGPYRKYVVWKGQLDESSK